MGEVIQLFKTAAPVAVEEEDPMESLTEEVADSIANVTYNIENLWKCKTKAELRDLLADVKREVNTWPKG